MAFPAGFVVGETGFEPATLCSQSVLFMFSCAYMGYQEQRINSLKPR